MSDEREVPLFKAAFTKIVAIDLDTGDTGWEAPTGDASADVGTRPQVVEQMTAGFPGSFERQSGAGGEDLASDLRHGTPCCRLERRQ